MNFQVTLAQSEELTELAKAKNNKTAVGAQAHASNLIFKVKEIIDSGNIGEVRSSTVTACISGFPTSWPEYLRYYHDITSGGNVLTIYIGHCKRYHQSSYSETRTQIHSSRVPHARPWRI